MPFKTDANGQIVTADHNGTKLPVFIHPDGKEAPFDADAAVASINARAQQSQRVEQENKALKELAAKFEGIDPAAAIKALNTVKSLSDKQLVDAGEVERVKNEAIKSVQAQFDPIVKERDTLKSELFNEKIGGAFARSKFIADKVAIPADMVQAAFGRHFSIEGGKVVAKGVDGNALFSRTRHGEPADFEEALEILVDSYPHKASILKGTGASGSGSQGGSGSGGGAGGGGKKTYTRQQFDAMSPMDKAAAAKEAATGKAVISD